MMIGQRDQVKGENNAPGRVIWNNATPDVKGQFAKLKPRRSDRRPRALPTRPAGSPGVLDRNLLRSGQQRLSADEPDVLGKQAVGPVASKENRGSRLWPPELIEFAALALRGAARAALADEHAWLSLDHRDRRAVIDQACRRHWGPDPLVDDDRHLENADALHEHLDPLAD